MRTRWHHLLAEPRRGFSPSWVVAISLFGLVGCAWGADGIPNQGSAWYHGPLNFGEHLWQDTQAVATVSASWDGGDWMEAGLVGVALAGSIAIADDSVERYSQRHRGHTTNRIASTANPLGTIDSFLVLGGFGLTGWACDDPRSESVAIDGVEASIIASGLITPALKIIVGRPRPNADHGPHDFIPFRGGQSFPSGHATQAFAVASTIATVYDDHLWVGVLAYGTAGLVGCARINDNKHWLSDVMMGAAIGTVVGTVVVHQDRQRSRQLTTSLILGSQVRGIQVDYRF